MFVVTRVNWGGGLALFWKNSIDVTVETFSKNHIGLIINKGNEDAWRFTGFYGELVTSEARILVETKTIKFSF